jgi:hypothetical protein
VETIFHKASLKKSSKGMRYRPEFLLECLLLHVKSPSAYEHLRTSNLLPLPDPDHLRRFLQGITCKFGFQDFSLKSISNEFHGKGFKECCSMVFS